MKTIRGRFLTAVGMAGLVFCAFVLFRTHALARKHSQNLLESQAALTLEFELALREYVTEVVRPAMQDVLSPDEFEPETMSGSYVTRSVFEAVRKQFPDHILRFASDNPRNPINQANAEELELIRYFNTHPEETSWSGEMTVNGEKYLATSAAMRMEQSCLACHGHPDDAPASLVEQYGRVGNFHRSPGSVIGVNTVAVPTRTVYASVLSGVAKESAVFFAALVVFVWGVHKILQRWILHRLSSMTRHFSQAAQLAGRTRIPAIPVSGEDEIGSVEQGFNTFAAELQVFHDSLEEKVAGRALQLEQTNASLRREVLHRRRVEERLEETRREQHQTEQTRKEFLSRMGREFCDPLDNIIRCTESLQQLSRDSGQDNWLPDLLKIEAAGKSLVTLVEDLIDLSRPDSEPPALSETTFEIPASVQEIVTSIRPLIENNENRLRVSCPPHLGRMRADASRFQQVLISLLEHANTSVRNGVVSLDVSRGVVNGKQMVTFRIGHTGIELKPQQIRQLFGEGAPGDGSLAPKPNLIFAKRTCERMGGHFSVESGEGKGTWFTCRFPAVTEGSAVPEGSPHSAAPQGKEPSPASRMEARTVLVIEEDPEARKLLTQALVNDGLQVFCASESEEGIRLARELDPSVIALDITLPGMTGWSALRAVKTDARLASKPILTFSLLEDSNLGYLLGLSDFVPKPLNENHLAGLFRKYQALSVSGPVLIVDDDPASHELVSGMLEEMGWTVLCVEDPSQAFEKMESESPALVLLNLILPQMAGYQFLADVHGVERFASTPIVAISETTLSEEARAQLYGTVENLVEAGARTREELVQEIRERARKVLRRKVTA